MNTPDQAWWARAQHARASLENRIIAHPDVSMIDIGLDPKGISKTPVLRVHISRGDGSTLKLPEELDGIPIRVIFGDYELQQGSSDSGA
jgi:hypothetical protein